MVARPSELFDWQVRHLDIYVHVSNESFTELINKPARKAKLI